MMLPSASARFPDSVAARSRREGESTITDVDRFEQAWSAVAPIRGWLAKEEAAALHAAARDVRPGHWIVEIGTHQGRSTAALATGKREGVPLLAIDPYGGTTATVPPTAMRSFCDNMDRLGAADDVQLFWGKSEEAARLRTRIFATARNRSGRDDDLRAGAASGGEVVLFPGSGEDAAQVRHRVFRVDDAGLPGQAGDASADASEPVIGLLFVDGRHDRVSVLKDIDLWEPLVGVGGAVVFHDAFFRRGVTRALFERHLVNREFRYERSLVNTSIFRRTEPLGAGAALVSALRMTTRTMHFGRNVATTAGVRRDWKWLQRLLPPSPDFEY